jgi:hypothetical protein
MDAQQSALVESIEGNFAAFHRHLGSTRYGTVIENPDLLCVFAGVPVGGYNGVFRSYLTADWWFTMSRGCAERRMIGQSSGGFYNTLLRITACYAGHFCPFWHSNRILRQNAGRGGIRAQAGWSRAPKRLFSQPELSRYPRPS